MKYINEPRLNTNNKYSFLQGVPTTSRNLYGPGIERPSEVAFLDEEPRNILQSGSYNKVPILTGYTDAEGILSVIIAARKGDEPIHKDFEEFVPLAFGLEKGSEKSKQIAQRIKQFYYGDKIPSQETLDAFILVS